MKLIIWRSAATIKCRTSRKVVNNMKGTQEYEMKINRSIENLISSSEHSDLLRRYKNYINDYAVSSKYDYLKKVNYFLSGINKDVKYVTIDDITGYMASLEYREDGRRYSQSYKISVYTALKHLFSYLYTVGDIDSNPMDNIKRPKAFESQEAIEKREIGYLTDKEIKIYLQSVMNGVGSRKAVSEQASWRKRDVAMILIFLSTGIRCSALMKLDIDSVDIDNNQLMVSDKGNKVRRYDLPYATMKAVIEWEIDRIYKLCGRDEDALFVSRNGNRMTQEGITKIIKKYSVNIKGKHITPHKLRATYATKLYDLTQDILFVQKCMNHASPKTTERYVRGKSDTLKKASDLMERVVGSGIM